MLRQPGSRYEIALSHTLLHVKSFKGDEAVVIGHVAGTVPSFPSSIGVHINAVPFKAKG
ncbi:hypothetical protein [Myxococcus landrumensis]|uniref:Uncharacterized protein n=1 Tax=Myxococcus landrumensis TaxID=2813577 RepID=A0ABX7N8D8_9BACT|nr:hypothetical protein [Myxococcus landrumus]QSQ12623.1 hypothetical protein JY572_30300 [Myxococcus landrumus]